MKPVTETDYRARIERVIRAISDEPEAPHTLDQLARIAHFSLCGELLILGKSVIRHTQASLLWRPVGNLR